MIKAEFWVLRNGVKCAELVADSATAARVSMENTAEIKMTLTGNFETNPQLNLITDQLQIWLDIDGQQYPLGRYIITDMQPSTSAAGRRTGSYTAYDLTYLVSRSTTERRYFIAAGTKYTDAIQALLIESGVTDYIIEETNEVLRTNREDWEPGTSRLQICNDLLAEINYNSLWMDLGGACRASKYRQATAENIDHSYRPGQYSMIYPETSQQLDLFERTNVFIRVVEDAENQTPLRAESVNDDPESSLSTVNQQRRVVDYDTLDNIASQAALQAYVDNLKFKSLLATEQTTFYTGPSPTHQAFDVVALLLDGAAGIYAETAWSIDLQPPWKMEHRGKKVVIL